MLIPIKSTAYEPEDLEGGYYDDPDEIINAWDEDDFTIKPYKVGYLFDNIGDVLDADAFEGVNGDTLAVRFQSFANIGTVPNFPFKPNTFEIELRMFNQNTFEWLDTTKGNCYLVLRNYSGDKKRAIFKIRHRSVMSKGFPPIFRYCFKIQGVYIFKWTVNDKTVFSVGLTEQCKIVGAYVENDEYNTQVLVDSTKVSALVAKHRFMNRY